MKPFVLLALLLGVFISALAQNSSSSTDGRKIVTLRNGNQLVGKVVRSGKDSLVLKVVTGERAIAQADIALIVDERTKKTEQKTTRKDELSPATTILATPQSFFVETIPPLTSLNFSTNIMTGASALITTVNGWYVNGSVNILPIYGFSNSFSKPVWDASIGKEILRRQKVSLDAEVSSFGSEYFESSEFNIGLRNHGGPILFSFKTGMGQSNFNVYGQAYADVRSNLLGQQAATHFTVSNTFMLRMTSGFALYFDQTVKYVPNWSTYFTNTNGGFLVKTGRFRVRPGAGFMIFDTETFKRVYFLTPRLEIGFTF